MGINRLGVDNFFRRPGVCLLFMLILGSLMVRADQYPYGYPTANLDVESKVSLEILRELALDDAQKTWGDVILGPEIPCSDVDGNINAYIFVFRIILNLETAESIGRFESYKEIQEGIRQGRKMYQETMEKIATSTIDNEIPVLQRKLHEARMKRGGADKYGTIIFSATYGNIPVRAKIYGLPFYYLNLNETYQKVQKELGGRPKLKRICIIGPSAIFYEFTESEKRIWINSFSNEIFESEPLIFEQERLRRIQSHGVGEKFRKMWEDRKMVVIKRMELP